eukprot:scaffold7303_cov153-Amphora_coffeaeformis.AAC.7
MDRTGMVGRVTTVSPHRNDGLGDQMAKEGRQHAARAQAGTVTGDTDAQDTDRQPEKGHQPKMVQYADAYGRIDRYHRVRIDIFIDYTCDFKRGGSSLPTKMLLLCVVLNGTCLGAQPTVRLPSRLQTKFCLKPAFLTGFKQKSV